LVHRSRALPLPPPNAVKVRRPDRRVAGCLETARAPYVVQPHASQIVGAPQGKITRVKARLQGVFQAYERGL